MFSILLSIRRFLSFLRSLSSNGTSECLCLLRVVGGNRSCFPSCYPSAGFPLLQSFTTAGFFFFFLLPFFSYFPALQKIALIKPYERLLRRNCLTNEVRSFSKEAVTRRFLAVLLQPAAFLCYFLCAATKKVNKYMNLICIFFTTCYPSTGFLIFSPKLHPQCTCCPSAGFSFFFLLPFFSYFPALQKIALIKPYERLLRRNCLTNKVRSLTKASRASMSKCCFRRARSQPQRKEHLGCRKKQSREGF